MTIIIKKSTETKKAYQIAQQLPHYFNEKGLSSIQQAVAAQQLFGAYRDEEMVGFITYQEVNPEVIEITWMAVAPNVQDQGVGSKLLLESLQQLDREYVVCQVKTLSEIDPDPEYARTRAFYRQLGFIPLETISPYPGWGKENPCQIFVKFLKKERPL